MSYLLNFIEEGKLNGSHRYAGNGRNCFDFNSSNYSTLVGDTYSFDKTKGHPFFVDSYFSLNESAISLSLSSLEFKDIGERSDYIKIGVH